MDNVMSLRNYIKNRDNISVSNKPQTFCILMNKVFKKIESEDRNIVKINLDEIMINSLTSEIILPEGLFANNLDKTFVINTPISTLTDRKSTPENRNVSFALMILGFYNNKEILSDLEALENFDEYINNIPNWLQNYFRNILKQSDVNIKFTAYYNEKFTETIKNKIKKVFSVYNLSSSMMDKVITIVGDKNEKNISLEEDNFKMGEQNTLDGLENQIIKTEEELLESKTIQIPTGEIREALIQNQHDENIGYSVGNSLVRVRNNGEVHKNLDFDEFLNITNDKAGSTFVLIVLGVIALIALVSFLTFMALKYIKQF